LIFDSDSDQEEPTYKVPVEDQDAKKWDCESIISTYSNIYNRPALIKDPPVSFKLFLYHILLEVLTFFTLQ